jgi:hypothetical protein
MQFHNGMYREFRNPLRKVVNKAAGINVKIRPMELEDISGILEVDQI